MALDLRWCFSPVSPLPADNPLSWNLHVTHCPGEVPWTVGCFPLCSGLRESWCFLAPKHRTMLHTDLMLILDGDDGYPRNTPLHRSAGEFLDRVNRGVETHPCCGRHLCESLGPRLNEKEKASWTPAFISLCFLTMNAIWPAAHTLAAMPLLPPQTASQNKSLHSNCQVHCHSNKKSN